MGKNDFSLFIGTLTKANLDHFQGFNSLFEVFNSIKDEYLGRIVSIFPTLDE
ncbi:hypothetical protein PECL_295 [Pediococcus claussenii ATCC BAA-344]|uniref:Uncharacterized protein n=1 Tax=Pediococcus claussenii (strain ATCC BAA-344 / DSM 14800 / JCM 18046 / KCTC 3811 / LMG 21948 / P06) TaxID=701521 RepID=G8PAP8_PEDCP|nr:hypothetical protein PECL_295 [Pediococcus claussenii ATCC BAA-344]KRN20787.1 hypothetical protein IV79_GL000007 [Pediococcus claussenii]